MGDFITITPLPRPSSWSERIGKVRQKGKVIREVSLVEKYRWGTYRKMIQEIELKNGKIVIRFGYYLKSPKKDDSDYRWGSQTTLIMGSKSNANKLIEKARAKGIL